MLDILYQFPYSPPQKEQSLITKYQIMEGSDYFERFVIVELPTFEDAVAYFESEEYQAAAEHRLDGSGDVETVIMDAIEGMGVN